MAVSSSDISIIIPVAVGDSTNALLSQLEGCGAEVIISSEDGRAKSLNIGAAKASKKFLWFLHADTILPDNATEMLQQSLSENEAALHYFKLFFNSPSKLMKLNAWGANIRSKIFKTPFGDQGFCMRKDLFFSVGGYLEDVNYGEDHLFVWHARRHGIMIKEVNAYIETSAEKYVKHGWLRTTLRYQYLWIKQALPQAWLLIRGK